MRTRLFLMISVLLIVIFTLTACGTEMNTPTEGVEAPAPKSEDEADPYPSPNEVYIPVTGSDPAYPAPGNDLEINPYPDSGNVDPYPASGDLSMKIDPEMNLSFDDLSPVADDKKLSMGKVFIESYELLIKESGPIQAELWVVGQLPTPCHQLRVVVSEPDAKGQINLRAYSVVDPEVMCIQVLEPFQTQIPLSDLPAGKFNIVINDEYKLDVEIP